MHSRLIFKFDASIQITQFISIDAGLMQFFCQHVDPFLWHDFIVNHDGVFQVTPFNQVHVQ